MLLWSKRWAGWLYHSVSLGAPTTRRGAFTPVGLLVLAFPRVGYCRRLRMRRSVLLTAMVCLAQWRTLRDPDSLP